jgi:hypothetical protein
MSQGEASQADFSISSKSNFLGEPHRFEDRNSTPEFKAGIQ